MYLSAKYVFQELMKICSQSLDVTALTVYITEIYATNRLLGWTSLPSTSVLRDGSDLRKFT